ncbi:MAG: hypothetical protein ABEJ31_01140 [Haloarculaceae archaeon]
MSGAEPRRLGAVLTAALVLASAVSAVAGPAAAAATAPPSGPATSDTFTVATDQILLGDGGEICAEKVGPYRNKLTIHNAELKGITMYLAASSSGVDKRISIPSANLTGDLVLYTNGENDLVNVLATAHTCVSLDQTNQTVVQVYSMNYDALDSTGMTMAAGKHVADDVPSPGGLSLPSMGDGSNDSSDGSGPVGVPETNGTVGPLPDGSGVASGGSGLVPAGTLPDQTPVTAPTDGPDAVSNATHSVTEPVTNGTGGLSNATDEVTNATDDALGSAPGGSNDSIEQSLTQLVNETTGTVSTTTQELTDDGSAANATDAVTNATGSLAGSGDAGSTAALSTDDGSAATTGTAAGDVSTDSTASVDDSADRTPASVDDTTQTATDTLSDTTDTVDDTTTSGTDAVTNSTVTSPLG